VNVTNKQKQSLIYVWKCILNNNISAETQFCYRLDKETNYDLTQTVVDSHCIGLS